MPTGTGRGQAVRLLRSLTAAGMVAVLLAAQGCAAGQAVTVDLRVLSSNRPLAKVLEAPSPQAEALKFQVLQGAAGSRAASHYEWARLNALAETGKGVERSFERRVQGWARKPIVLRAATPPGRRLEARLVVQTEGCCGLALADSTLAVRDAEGESSVTFSCPVPWTRMPLIELPPTHEGGRWTWILLDVQKVSATAPAG